MKYFAFFLYMLLVTSDISGISNDVNKRTKPLENVKTSIIIPCCAKHAEHLYILLRMYENQTELPDEIIISLSEFNQVDDNIIKELQNKKWSFPVKLIASDKKQFAGENRNVACSHASGDIFICQDADDLPHPQRVEIIKYFFKNYHIDHLMHLCKVVKEKDKDKSRVSFLYNDFTEIKYLFSNNLNKVRESGRFTNDSAAMAFHNGNVAITKHVFDQIKWSTTMKQGQDVHFNQRVYQRFKNCIAIYVDLLTYRNFLSSHIQTPQYYYKKDVELINEDREIYKVEIIH